MTGEGRAEPDIKETVLMETESTGIREFLANPTNIRKINRAIRGAIADKREGGDVLTRILVVDSNAAARETVVQALSRAGYDVQAASGESEAMSIFDEKPADLVVADLNLPDGGGLQTVASFVRRFPDVKIIAISSTAGPLGSTLTVCRALGAARTLVRPFENGELLDAVTEVAGV